MRSVGFVAAALAVLFVTAAAAEPDAAAFDRAVLAVAPKVTAWRRDIHANPELGNQETRTAALVAAHLKSLKFDEVITGVAHTGVIGILKGGKPGPVVALRADMDALPIAERVDVPFASRAKAIWDGKEVPVMHACGHDAHTAMLMGAATVLAGMRAEIAGSVMFVFQPAEEGVQQGEEGGARLILKEGALDGARAPKAIFGLHVWPGTAGTVSVRPRGQNASADELKITIRGKAAHGAQPWYGVDPVIVAAQVMVGLQMIPARQLNATTAPTVITIGSIHGGVRSNIVPETVEMVGTIRSLDPKLREETHARIRQTATSIAAAAGAAAEVAIQEYAPVNYNDPALTERMMPALRRAAGAGGVQEMELVMGSEDFAWYGAKAPSLYVFLGINQPGVPNGKGPGNHTSDFSVNEDVLPTGVRTMALLALEYLAGEAKTPSPTRRN